jgi:steroid 5-alpha reductase family enzyme
MHFLKPYALNLKPFMDYKHLLFIALISLIACCFIMAMVWLWAKKIKNAGVVDVFWALNFPVITLITLVMIPEKY